MCTDTMHRRALGTNNTHLIEVGFDAIEDPQAGCRLLRDSTEFQLCWPGRWSPGDGCAYGHEEPDHTARLLFEPKLDKSSIGSLCF